MKMVYCNCDGRTNERTMIYSPPRIPLLQDAVTGLPICEECPPQPTAVQIAVNISLIVILTIAVVSFLAYLRCHQRVRCVWRCISYVCTRALLARGRQTRGVKTHPSAKYPSAKYEKYPSAKYEEYPSAKYEEYPSAKYEKCP